MLCMMLLRLWCLGMKSVCAVLMSSDLHSLTLDMLVSLSPKTARSAEVVESAPWFRSQCSRASCCLSLFVSGLDFGLRRFVFCFFLCMVITFAKKASCASLRLYFAPSLTLFLVEVGAGVFPLLAFWRFAFLWFGFVFGYFCCSFFGSQ